MTATCHDYVIQGSADRLVLFIVLLLKLETVASVILAPLTAF